MVHSPPPGSRARTVALRIEGMHCTHCVRALGRALAAVPRVHVRSVTVGTALIDAADPDAVDLALGAIREAGFLPAPASDAGDTGTTT